MSSKKVIDIPRTAGNKVASNGKANKLVSKVSYQTTPEEESAKVKWCIRELISKGIDITQDYGDWVKMAFAFMDLTDGNNLFHELSEMYADYNYDECEAKWNQLKGKTNNGSTITIASFFAKCKDYDVSVKDMPKVITDDLDQDPVFWIIDSNNDLKILWIGLYDFLGYHGYRTLIYLDTKIHARIQNNIVTKVDCLDIKHFVLDWVDKHLD